MAAKDRDRTGSDIRDHGGHSELNTGGRKFCDLPAAILAGGSNIRRADS